MVSTLLLKGRKNSSSLPSEEEENNAARAIISFFVHLEELGVVLELNHPQIKLNHSQIKSVVNIVTRALEIQTKKDLPLFFSRFQEKALPLTESSKPPPNIFFSLAAILSQLTSSSETGVTITLPLGEWRKELKNHFQQNPKERRSAEKEIGNLASFSPPLFVVTPTNGL